MVRGPRTAMKSGPRLPQLEKALAQKRRPNTPINNKFKKNMKNILGWETDHLFCPSLWEIAKAIQGCVALGMLPNLSVLQFAHLLKQRL